MVKAAKSKGGKGAKGRGPGSDRSGAVGAPSPTRRLKKGAGKRGRRLCHMEGCTLCPSFGFEGEVAVSCSHHKEPGMRNLTARRCQAEGCFTVANFGLPGDKPGFCAAHSSAGMVNRNKPRGGEGLLGGVGIGRSSRRAAKANTALQGLRLAVAKRGGVQHEGGDSTSSMGAKTSSYSGVLSGPDPGYMETDGDGDGPSHTHHGSLDSPASVMDTTASVTVRSRLPFGDGSDDRSFDREACEMKNGFISGRNMKVDKEKRAHAPSRGTYMISASGGEDLPEPNMVPYSNGSSRGNHGRQGEFATGFENAGRLRARGGGAAAAAVTTSQGMHLPRGRDGAAEQEAYLRAHCSGLKAAQMGQPVHSIMHKAETGCGAVNAGFPVDLRGDSGMVDGSKGAAPVVGDMITCTTASDSLESYDNTTNDLLALLEADDDVDEPKDGGDPPQDMVPSERRINLARALQCAQDLSGSSGSGGNLCASAWARQAASSEHRGGIRRGQESDALSMSDGDNGKDFSGFVNLPGSNSMNLGDLGNAEAGSDGIRRGAAASRPVCSSASIGISNSRGVSTGLPVSTVPSLSLSAISAEMFTTTDGTLRSSAMSAPLTSSTTAASDAPASAPSPLPGGSGGGAGGSEGGVMPNDEILWSLLDGEEFVAMPEPIWAADSVGAAAAADVPSARVPAEDIPVWRHGAPSAPRPPSRSAGVSSLPSGLGGRGFGGGHSGGEGCGGDNGGVGVVRKDSKDSLQGLLLDQPSDVKPRGLLTSSPSPVGDRHPSMVGMGFVTADEKRSMGDRVGCSSEGGGAEGPSRFPLLSGGGPLPGERDELGHMDAMHMSPVKRRQRPQSSGEMSDA